jgi:hypothetical protein
VSNPIFEHSIDDEADMLRIDEPWNEAYRQHDRLPLAGILSDDFAALNASGEGTYISL